MIHGIDVASYQGDTYETSGLDYVFTKASEGTSYVNPHQGHQAAVARTAGLALGFYHFLHPGNIKAQAQFYVRVCASMLGDMLVCDWETVPGATGATNAEKDMFIQEVKRLRPTHKVGLYCNRDYWLHRDSTSYCGDFLWIADPGVPAGKPRIKHPWAFHQYAIKGGIDQDVADFESRQELRKWCGYADAQPTKKTPPPPAQTPAGRTLAQLDRAVTAIENKLGLPHTR